MSTLIIVLIVVHLVIGFGWAIYKLEFQKKPNKDQAEDQ